MKKENGEAGPYVFKSYKEIHTEVANVASALRALGVNPAQRVGVFGANCPEWMVAMQVRSFVARVARGWRFERYWETIVSTAQYGLSLQASLALVARSGLPRWPGLLSWHSEDRASQSEEAYGSVVGQTADA